MKLIAVVTIPESKDCTDRLQIKGILKNKYNDNHEIYNAFRRAVPNGRFGLAMSKDATGKYPLIFIDTQLLARHSNLKEKI